MVRADDLGKRFGTRWVFRAVSFCLEPGDVLLVRGSNGAGKSTLLRMMAGLWTPSTGSITFDASVGRTGYAAVDQNLYPALTVAEHLAFTRDTQGQTADFSLEQFGLSALADRRVGELSSGQRARVKLATAIQPGPGLLLLDEPSATLDEEGLEVIGRLLTVQRTRGVAMIATNDPRDRRFATHELVLHA